MTEHAVNNGTSICQTAEATHLILPFEDFCAAKTVGFTYRGQRADLEFHLVNDPETSEEIQLLLYVRNISSRLWHVLIYEDPFNNDSDTAVKELPPNEDIYLYPIKEFSFGNRDELIVYFRFDRDAEMLQTPEITQEQLEQLWRRLQSIRKDAAFADMTVNGLPAHRAVLAAGSGRLHETISKLDSNYQSCCEGPTTHDPAISNKSSEHNNVDTENDNTKPSDGGHQNDDDQKHCNNEGSVEVKTNNGGNKGNHNEEHQNQEALKKITDDMKESSKDNIRLLKHIDRHEESTSGLKRDWNIMSGENGVNTTQSEVIDNDALISDETVQKIKRSRRTEDKKITQEAADSHCRFLLQLSELIGNRQISVKEIFSMAKNFLTEHVVHKEEIEILEHPQPDNYKLEMPELRNSESTEMFVEYIYTNSLDMGQKMKIQSTEDLLTVALLLDLENIETDTALQISQCSSQTIELTTKFLHLAKIYDLYTFKLNTIILIRWYFDFHSENPLARCLLTMPSHHRYQKQCVLTLKVPNISKLKEHNSNVFYICGIPLQISVGRINNGFIIKVQVKNKGNMPLLIVRSQLMSSIIGQYKSRTFKVGVRYRLIEWQSLIDPANGYIVDDSIELRVSVMDYSWYTGLRDRHTHHMTMRWT